MHIHNHITRDIDKIPSAGYTVGELLTMLGLAPTDAILERVFTQYEVAVLDAGVVSDPSFHVAKEFIKTNGAHIRFRDKQTEESFYVGSFTIPFAGNLRNNSQEE